jgi:CRP/FNR family transcriptional regulator/CRP/FNR family cyclic AMP-dependent transcriptional regulator
LISEFLKNVNIFTNLSDSILNEIEELFVLRKYPKGSMIILEEEYGDVLFIVKTGTIKITRVNDEGREVILSLMGSYDIFGELAIIDGEARSANVLAQEDCELYAIRSEEFLGILRNNFKISLALMEELAGRIRKSDQHIEALSLSDAEHRIGVSILNLAEEMGIIRKGRVTIENLPFQQDIANMSGTSRETVSRILKLFEDKNMLSKSGHKLIIPDYVNFKRYFG